MARVILDANVLVTGIFVAQSKSRQVLNNIQKGYIVGYIVENTIDEVMGVANRVHRNTGVDVTETLQGAISNLGLIILPRVSRSEAKVYKKIKGIGDKSIVAAACKSATVVCSNDLKDFRESSVYGVTVSTPNDLVNDGTIRINAIYPGFISTPQEGAFYVEVTSLNWTNVKFKNTATNRVYFFDLKGFGALFFKADTHSFIFQMDNGIRMILEHGVVTDKDLPIKIILTYKASLGLDMYIGYRGKKVSIKKKWIPEAMPSDARISLGCDRHGKRQISGVILTLFSVPNYMTEKASNNLIAGATVKQPWERLGLEDIFQMMFKNLE